MSVGQILDAASASYNGRMLGEYRMSIERDSASRYASEDDKEAADQADEDARNVLLAVEKGARVAAGYDHRSSFDIPQHELLRGAEWCANALTVAVEYEIVLDVAEEAAQTVRAVARR